MRQEGEPNPNLPTPPVNLNRRRALRFILASTLATLAGPSQPQICTTNGIKRTNGLRRR
jgi:hypothetical protein